MRVPRFIVRTGSSLACLSLVAATSAADDNPGPRVGEEFVVNSYTTNLQDEPAVARTGDGEFVVVWRSRGSYGSDDSGYSIQGQRFAADGSFAGRQFQVNMEITYVQEHPEVAVGPKGDFVVVWRGQNQIQGQRFMADGSPLGDEFRVNTYSSGTLHPAVAVAADGSFVVAWQSYGSPGDDDLPGTSIQLRRYAADGSPLGDQFQVNSWTTGYQWLPDVAVHPDGRFVVVWQSLGSTADSSSWGVLGQRYAPDGLPSGGEFQVNSWTQAGQAEPTVAATGDGFVVAWASELSAGSDTDGESIQVRRFAIDATPLGSEFQANSYTLFGQVDPSIAMSEDGGLVVVWHSVFAPGPDPSLSVEGQRYGADGEPIGHQFQVNTVSTNAQRQPSVAMGPGGDFVVAWTNDATGDISGQLFSPSLFSDGFESGDTTAWSATVP